MQVIWNKQAAKQFEMIINYIHQEFGERVALQFYNRVISYEPLLAANPRIGAKEPLLRRRKQNFRSIVVHKYCKLIYYVEDDMLYIADLWDTRRNPRSLADSLK